MLSLIAEKLVEVLGVTFLHTMAEHVVKDQRTLVSALSHSAVFRSRRLRVSIAQILSLMVDDKFVLIKSVKRKESWAPIGGVVRYFPAAMPELEGEIRFKPETESGPERFDLRGRIEGRDFNHFLRWLASGSGREHQALAREIEEEFCEIGIKSITKFVKRPEFHKDRIVHEGPTRTAGREYWQYRYFEVLSLEQESEQSQQLANFMKSKAANHPDLVLVSSDEIRTGRCKNGRIIADSASYLFSDARFGFEPPHFR